MSKETPLKIEVIKVIYSAVLPIYYKMQALLEDIKCKEIIISDIDKAILLDMISCSLSLKCMFEEYIEEAADANVEQIYLQEKEFNTLMQMSKLLETSTRMKFGNIVIWSH